MADRKLSFTIQQRAHVKVMAGSGRLIDAQRFIVACLKKGERRG